MIIIDSNVWISYFHEEDINHQKARKIVTPQLDIVIPECVVVELSTVLTHKIGKSNTDLIIKNLINNKNIAILYSSREFFLTILNFYLKKTNKNLSFVDYSLLYLSSSYDIITFDRALTREIKNYSV